VRDRLEIIGDSRWWKRAIIERRVMLALGVEKWRNSAAQQLEIAKEIPRFAGGEKLFSAS